MIDLIGPLYQIFKDISCLIHNKFQKPDPSVVLKRRQEWHHEFETHLQKKSDTSNFGNAIIRDISRMDNYPKIDDGKKGISSWFPVEIKGLYHRGIEVILRIDSLVYVADFRQWHFSPNGGKGTVNAFLVGQIPFDLIRYVEWNGDEYYRYPHIYCEFNKKKKQPYENLVYYVREGSDEYCYFSEITKLENITKSKKTSSKKTYMSVQDLTNK